MNRCRAAGLLRRQDRNMDPEHPTTELTDLWGNSVHTNSSACIRYINAYYLEVLSYGSNQKVILKALEEDCNCTLAHVLFALHSLRSNSNEALSSIAAAKHCLLHSTPYERMALSAAEALVKEQLDVALIEYSKILAQFPKDLFSLKRAQVLCFYMGRCEESLRLASQVLPWNKEEAYIYGMLAFALLETHHFDEAEEAARKALTIKSADKWAQHAFCHVLQYRCLFQDAIRFMERNKESWNDCCTFMYSHNWWHLAVSYLEWGGGDSLDKVIEIYDNHLWPCKSRDLSSSVQALLSALGLLLRLQVRGLTECVKGRILPVAQQVRDSSVWHKERLLDLLMIWAWAYAGEDKSCDRLKELQQSCSNQTKKKDMRMFLKLAEGLYEYGKGNLKEAFNIVGPQFKTKELKVIGASDEQLDIFEELWCLVALHAGHFEGVYEVLKKRVTVFPGSPFSWDLMAEFYKRTGSPDELQNVKMKADIIKQGYLQFGSQ